MANNFEYKIHISIDQNSVKGDVRDILKNMKSEIENGVYKVKLTGDPNNLLKQLSDLQKKMPDIDLTKGIQFGLADTINAQTEQGKKMLNEFVTFMTNAINDSMSNINNLKQQISSVEGSLKTSKGKLDLLGAGDANKALDNLTKKFKNIKAEEKNIGELRDVFQQIKDISSSIGKDLPKGVEEYQNKIQNTLKKDIFKDIVPSKTYAEYFQEASTEVLEFENKLVELKKELETAMNPEVKVKGKLSEGFISDLQSQLDSTDGIEVKVKPVVDKDFELELKANIKPNNNGNSGTNQIKKDADEINKKVEAAVSNFNLLQEHINKYKTNLDISKSGDSLMTYSSGKNTSISHYVHASDIRKGAPTYKSITKELQEYLDIKKAVETGITKSGNENIFYNEKHIDMQLNKLAAYVYSLHNAEKAAELFGEKNKEVFDLVQKRIEQNIKAGEAREKLEYISGWIAGDLKRDYGVESVTLGQFDKLEEAINTGGIEAFAAKAKELFGVEIPTSVEQAKNSVEGFNQAASSDSTASAQDRTQSEFRETAEAAEETKEATSVAFNPEQLKQFTELLSTISGHLESIKGLIGTINETEGIKSLVDGFDTLLLKIEEIQERVSGGLLNVNVNQEGMYGSGADRAIDKTLSDLRNRYDKVVQIFGGEDSMFNRFGVVGTNLQELYSRGSINGLDNAKMQINRIREFFKEFRNLKEIIQAEIDNARIDFDAYMNGITSGKDKKTNLSIEEIIRKAETSRKNKKASNLNTYEKEAYNRYLGIQEQEDVLAKLNKITAPAKSNAYLNSSIQKIQQAEVDEYARIQELGKADLSPVINALKNIEKLLESISNKKIFDTESIDTFINRLNDVIEKIHSVTDASQEAVSTSGQSTQGTKTQGSSDKDKISDASKNAERKAAAEEKAIKAAERKAEAEERAAKAAEKKADAAEKKAAAEEKKAAATEKKAEAEEKRVAATEKRIAAEEKAAKAAEEKAAKAAEEKATTDDKIFASKKEKAISDLNNKKINITEGFKYSDGLSDRISDVKARIDSLKQGLESIKDSSGMKTWESEFRTLSSLIKGVNASIKEEEKAFNDADNAAKKEAKSEQILLSQRSALLKRLSVLMQNGGIMKDQQWGSYIREQFNLINSSADVSADKIREVGLELNRIETEANAAGKSGQTLFQLISQRAKSLIAYLGTFASFYRVVGYIRSAFTTLKDLDTQLVDLRKTTTMTTYELDNFYKSSTNVGKELGVTTSEIISQAAAWSRLGYSSNEAATQMAELSSKFASISPGMSTDNATDYLVSTMKAFGIETDEVERKIMDNVNRIGNTFATTNAEIGEMLTRSSAAMKAANNSLEETIALESAAVEITRNAETTGTAFRTISMRIRGYDEETEELSDDLKDISGDIADLTKVAGKGGITLFTDETKKTYKSTYQILKDISEIWHDLTDKQQAALLEKLGGKRGAQSLAGILNDFSSVEKALKTMENAAGSADKEMGIIQDSLEYKINALKQTWTGILQDLVDKGTIGRLVDALTEISEALGSILNKTGLLQTALIGIGTFIGAKKLNLFDYNKQAGFQVGGMALGNLTKGSSLNGQEILGQSQNTEFLKMVEDVGIADAEVIDGLAATYEANFNSKIHPAIVQHAKDWMGASDEVKKAGSITESFAAQNTTMLQNLSAGMKNFGSSIKNFALNGLAMLGNAFTSMVISTAVSFAITGIIKAVDKWIITAKEATAMTEQFRDSFSSMTERQGRTAKTIADIDGEFQKLSKGVNALGENVSLTEEEFDRYHEITQIINDNIPTLIKGYDDQGNAIVDLTTKVTSLSDAYKDMQQQEAYAAYNAVDEDGNRIIEGVYKNAQSKVREAVMEKSKAEQNKEVLEEYVNADMEQLQEIYRKAWDEKDFGTIGILEGAGFRNDENNNYAEIHSGLLKQYQEQISLIRKYESDLKAVASDVSNAGKEYAQSLSAYWNDLDDSQRKLFDSFLSGINDTDALDEISKAFDTSLLNEDDMNTFISTMISEFSKLNSEDMDVITARFNLVTMFNNNEISLGEYESKIQEFNDNITTLPDNIQKIINVLFDLSIDTDGEQNIEDQKNHLKNLMGGNWKDEYANEFTEEELEVAMQITIGDPKWDAMDFETVKKKISEILNPVEVNVEPEVKASTAINSMAQAKEAITSLNDLWEQTVQNNLALKKDKKYVDADGNVTKKLDDQNLAVGYADPALINSVESAFKGFVQEIDNAGGDVTKLNLALEEFETTMVEQPGDAEAAQNAIDHLITAYIDQTSIIQNLTEENKEWSIAQLEAMGITNAQEVVESRLNKTVKETQKNIAKLSKYLLENADVLNKANKGTESYKTAISGMVEDVKSALSVYDEDGNEINLGINIDDTFVEEHLADIQAMAAGDEEALNRVRRAAAEEAVLKVTTNVDDEYALASIQNLMDKVMEVDAMDIEVGASIDDAPFLAALNEMLVSSGYTADQVAAAFESMGYDATWVPNRYTVKTATAIMSTGGPTSLNGDKNDAATFGMQKGVAYLKHEETEIDVPDLIITRKGRGGGGKVAHYGGGGGGSSSGGGGGGGGSSSEPNKPKEEAEETFDWIEVAIQRIEEEIARLDKVVGNSYDFWTNRNEALLKEIDKTKEEIKAQQTAYSEYLRNANDIKVNNGKGLNPDDYGKNDADVKKHDQELLNEAIAAWDTGEYQKKVREGLLSGKDIEKIANHFLTDTIKEYQEWYNKAIAVSDAMQDNKIKLGDLARTDFDHIKTEYDEMLQYFEAYADLIDKRISRTEEKGYFVSKNYYDQLTDYEKKSITTLREETDKLIKKRDEAVNAGDIALNSEEYHKMTQEILDNLQSIEERTNNIYENANKIRQIGWDIFDYIEDRISKVTDEFEFLIDLLDNQKMYDDYGIFNERGWANTALHAGKYNTYMQQALDYAKEREKIETQLKEDKADKNLIERREELIQLQQESIKNAYAEKDAVKSLVEEGINIHLSKLKELIDDYKKAQQESKNLYDYQKNISKQTENIGNLRKQLNAYVGDTSEEARATIQKLSKSLEDAETQLKETQWDKYISETETFLSDMYDEYEETLNARLDDIDLLMHDMIDEVNARGTEISGIIKEVSGEVAYELTDYTKTFISNGTLVSDFKNKFDTEITNVKSILGNIQKYIADIANKQVTPAVNENSIKKGTKLNNHATYKGVDYSSIFNLEYYMNKYPNLVSVFGTDYDKYIEHFVNYGMKEGRQASETFNLEYYKKKYPDLVKAFGNNNQAYYEHFIEYGIKEGRQASETFSVQMYKNLYEDLAKSFKNNLKKYYEHYNNYGRFEGRRAYATGSKHISSNQLAWTQDGGGELIYRSTDGAILTPLNVGDKVFTTEMSENLWNLAQLKQRPVVVSTGAGRTVNNTNAISINLPNVQNYEQFKNALQNDPNMTKFIQQVTFGEATNGIKLNKKKY